MILAKSEQKLQVQITEQIESEALEINQTNQDVLVLFKIFGEKQFSFQLASAKSISDWSAFYTQLNPEHSIRYLTKKWSDGSEFACLIKINVNIGEKNKRLRLIKIKHSCLGNHSISGQQKARLIKKHLSQKYKIIFQDINKDEEPLMKKLGQLGILLSCIDCQQQQVIIPHNILNKEYFQYKGLIQFKRSNDGMLRTLGWQPYKMLPQDDIWNKISGQQQFEPYLLLKTNEQIKQILKNS